MVPLSICEVGLKDDIHIPQIVVHMVTITTDRDTLS